LNVTLTVKNKRYYIILEKVINGKKYIKRSNNYKFIKALIEDLGDINLINVSFLNKELYFDNGIKVVLKNCPLYEETYLYKKVIKKTTKNTKVKKNYKKINSEKIISLVLTGCMLTTAALTFSKQPKKTYLKTLNEITEEKINENNSTLVYENDISFLSEIEDDEKIHSEYSVDIDTLQNSKKR